MRRERHIAEIALRKRDHGFRSLRSGARSRARGLLVAEATDDTGTVVGEFEPRGLRRVGALRWAGRDLMLRPASLWRERYALADGDHELAILDGRGWGRRPVRITVEDLAALEPELLLFTAFVVRGLAEDAASAAGAGAATSATTTGG